MDEVLVDVGGEEVASAATQEGSRLVLTLPGGTVLGPEAVLEVTVGWQA